MNIEPPWKLALWIPITNGTTEERYRPVTAEGKCVRLDLDINWPASRSWIFHIWLTPGNPYMIFDPNNVLHSGQGSAYQILWS